MDKKIVALLAIALLISLAGCGATSGVDDVPPSNSIESSQAPIETPETPTEPTESTDPAQDPPKGEEPTEPTQEPVQEPTEEPKETTPTNEKPTTEPTQEPTTPPATPAPVNTPTPTAPPAPVATPTPTPVHTHSYTVTTKATCTSEGIETCSCGETKVIPATGQHDYQPQTIQGTGHYEQVQVGTEQVLVRNEKREYSKCLKCGAIAYTNEEAYGHYDAESPYFSEDCWNSHNMIYTEYVPVYEEQPKYENQWVIDTPDQTIYKCSVCGQEKP